MQIVFMGISGGPVYGCGENGIILRTSNNGNNWSVIPSPVSKSFRDISDFNFVAVGDSGVILKSTNEGLNWFTVTSPTVKIYDVLCIEIRTLLNENKTAGRHKIMFDGSDLSSGTLLQT